MAIIKSLDGKLMLILEGKEDKEFIKEFFSSLVSSLYYNDELISGESFLMIEVLSKKFMVRKDSFFQVNKEGVSLIYKEVISPSTLGFKASITSLIFSFLTLSNNLSSPISSGLTSSSGEISPLIT